LLDSSFKDFDGFELIDKHNEGKQGDFHLKFKIFDVLVDAKNYSNKVPTKETNKIKRDLKMNDHLHFAWMISLNTKITSFDKSPIMFEWIEENKCICYINCLMEHEEPGELLRAVWYCCKSLKQMMTTGESEKGELSVLKEREMKMRDILEKLVKSNKERDTLMTQFRQNFDRSDAYIREMLNAETDLVVNQYYRVVVEWWNRHLEENPNAPIPIKSTLLWTQFKREMGDNLGEIDVSTFKDILCGFLGEDKVIKPKMKGGALDIRGVQWREGVKLR
jgi:hypothetical protein